MSKVQKFPKSTLKFWGSSEPERVTNINEAMQWTKFARARGLAGAPRRIADDDDDDAPPTTNANKFIFEVADDEDNEEVRFALT